MLRGNGTVSFSGNSYGAIYGGSYSSVVLNGNVAGFTLATVPEPATATLSLLALAALAARRRRG